VFARLPANSFSPLTHPSAFVLNYIQAREGQLPSRACALAAITKYPVGTSCSAPYHPRRGHRRHREASLWDESAVLFICVAYHSRRGPRGLRPRRSPISGGICFNKPIYGVLECLGIFSGISCCNRLQLDETIFTILAQTASQFGLPYVSPNRRSTPPFHSALSVFAARRYQE
jgi:hypothetical protein